MFICKRREVRDALGMEHPIMATNLSLIGIFVWFSWGFFMGLGWTLAAWLLGKVLR